MWVIAVLTTTTTATTMAGWIHAFSGKAPREAGLREEKQAVTGQYSAQYCHVHAQVSRNPIQQFLYYAGRRADVMCLVTFPY